MKMAKPADCYDEVRPQELHSGPDPTRKRTADAQHDEANASGQQGVIILAFTIGTNGKTRYQTQGTSSAME
jgi:hypothetical protein